MNCGQCRFWQPRTDGHANRIEFAPGHCRRDAPVRVADGHNVEPGWPPTLANDWCGSYEPFAEGIPGWDVPRTT